MVVEQTVKMEVTATVTFPDGAPDTSEEKCKEMAMSAVTQSQEVDCGEPGRVLWCKVYAEVSEDDCEVE